MKDPFQSSNSTDHISKCCTDCAVAVEKEWAKVKVAEQKLAIQQERLKLDQEMLRVERKNLRRSSKLAHKVNQNSKIEGVHSSAPQDNGDRVLEALKVELEATKSQLVTAESKLETSADSISKDQHLKSIESINKELEVTRRSLADALAEKDLVQRDKEELEQGLLKLKESEKQFSGSCHLCEDRRMKEQILEEEVQNMRAQLANSRETFNKEKLEWKLISDDKDEKTEKERARFEEEGRRMRQESEGLRAKIENLREKLKAAELKSAEENSGLHDADNDVTLLQEEKASLERLLLEKCRQIEDLEILLPSQKAMLEQAHTKTKRLQNKVDQLESQYRDQEELIRELQASKEALVKLQQQQQQDLAALQKAQKEGRIVDIRTRTNQDLSHSPTNMKTSVRCKHDIPLPLDSSEISDEAKHVIEWEWTSPTGLYGMYTGWLDLTGNPNGHGTLRIEDGSIYDGEWNSGLRSGRGVYTSIDGDLYRGDWMDDLQHGRGVYVWPDGQVYTGDYSMGRREGKGIETWPHGARYEGDYRQDRRNGRGTYWYPDGRCYRGEYTDDRPNGQGTQTASDGTVLLDGQWNLGEFING